MKVGTVCDKFLRAHLSTDWNFCSPNSSLPSCYLQANKQIFFCRFLVKTTYLQENKGVLKCFNIFVRSCFIQPVIVILIDINV